VPAAIFMAVCRTLLRATAIQGMPSGECMSYINRILSKQSDVTMYVTAFYGILDTTTGDVDYCLAGHCSPYLLSATEPAFQITEPRGLVAGMFEHAKYTSGHLRLGTGDTLFLYTDGITEADDGRYQEYSERRLEEALNRVRHMGAQDIVMEVTHDVRNFAGQAPQSDDLTMLALRYLAAD
jgi:sigma-B regulation protein RsbU (phosphoserine phosphatase)